MNSSPVVEMKTTQANEQEPNRQQKYYSNFTFPSIQERVEYYMGDWWNRTLQHDEINCSLIDNEQGPSYGMHYDNLYTVSYLKRALAVRTDWISVNYLSNVLSIVDYSHHDNNVTKKEINHLMGGSKQREDDPGVIAHLGDSHPKESHMKHLPIVSKTRYTQKVLSKHNRTSNIIWPLGMARHYTPVQQYIEKKKKGKETPWEKKKETVVFRGAITGDHPDKVYITGLKKGPRSHVVDMYMHYNKSDIDVFFSLGNAVSLSMVDQLKYKYLLSIEGNDVATGLKWQLASDSVVFMAKPVTVSFAMEELLVPFVHYVPVNDDYSNLPQMVEWARNNDDQCRWIAKQATLYMEHLWMSEKAQEEYVAIKRELGKQYRKQFGAITDKCDGSDWGIPADD